MSILPLKMLKDHLRITHSAEDAMIQTYLDAAESAVSNCVQRPLIDYCKDPVGQELNLPSDVMAAVLIFGAHLYENRVAVVDKSAVVLPMAFEYLLATHRFWGPEPTL